MEKGLPTATLDEGLTFETEAMVPLIGSTISKNLIFPLFMNQRLSKDPGVTDTTIQPKPVQRIGVLGAGTHGGRNCRCKHPQRYTCCHVGQHAKALEKGVGGIAAGFKGLVEKGRMKPDDLWLLVRSARLNAVGSLGNVAECDVVVEAIVENEEVKTSVYNNWNHCCGRNASLASNTSTISITRMATALKNPARFAGLHFFNPVERMPAGRG